MTPHSNDIWNYYIFILHAYIKSSINQKVIISLYLIDGPTAKHLLEQHAMILIYISPQI